MTKKEITQLFLITIIFIAACIETDIYLPAFPDMMDYFKVSEEAIQGLLTWNFIGICLSGPLYGPVSDAFGRRTPLLWALGLFGLGSAVTMFAVDFDLMLVGRILQGLGSGGCFTLGTAIIFDAFPKERAVFAINQLNTVIPIIMAVAPMAGGILNQTYGFRSNFLAIAVFVAISFLVCLIFFDETLKKKDRKEFKAKKIFKDFGRAMTCVPFWETTIFVSLMFGIYIAFLSIIAVFFVLELGIPKDVFPWFQTAILGAWVAASLSYHRVAKLLKSHFRKVGFITTFVGSFAFCLFAIFFPTNPYLMTAGMMVTSIGFNFTMTIYFNECMLWLDDMKGIAASLSTSARLFFSAIFVGISGKIYDKTIVPFALLSLVTVILSLIMVWHYEKNYAKSLDKKDDESLGMAGH